VIYHQAASSSPPGDLSSGSGLRRPGCPLWPKPPRSRDGWCHSV